MKFVQQGEMLRIVNEDHLAEAHKRVILEIFLPLAGCTVTGYALHLKLLRSAESMTRYGHIQDCYTAEGVRRRINSIVEKTGSDQ